MLNGVRRFISNVKPVPTASRAAAIAHGLLIYVLTPVALAIVIETLATGQSGAGLAFAAEYPRAFVFTVVTLLALLLLAIACLGSYFGPLALVVLTAGGAAVSGQKMHYLGEPLFPWDYLSTHQVFSLLPLLAKERPLVLPMLAVMALLVIPPIVLIARHYDPQWPVLARTERKLAAVVGLLLAAGLGLLPYTNYVNLIARYSGITYIGWDQAANYRQNGFLLAFVDNASAANVEGPRIPINRAGASLKLSGQNPAPAGSAPTLPDIIVVMSESFWDPTKLPGVSFSFDPMPTVRRLAVGALVSPAFGGGTCNVEFEFLTGFSNAFLPYGSLPYQQYIKRQIPSLAHALKAQGYGAIALHPFHKTFWNRDTVYPHMGFDRFDGEEEGRFVKAERRGGVASDRALSQAIMAEVDDAQRPVFLFAVSMQNHGPYAPGRYPRRIEATGSLTKPEQGMIETFADGIFDADEGLRLLVEWAGQRKRPTVIVFFGDHLPGLGPNFGLYSRTGFLQQPKRAFLNMGRRSLSPDEYRATGETPLVIWSNYLPPLKPTGPISPSLLPHVLLDWMGIDHPFYRDFLGQVHAKASVIDRRLLDTRDGRSLQSPGAGVLSILDEYQTLQYGAMFGAPADVARMFPEMLKVPAPK